MIVGYVFCFIVGAVLGILASALSNGPEYPSVPCDDFDFNVDLDDIILESSDSL